jgi:hypothetical protein
MRWITVALAFVITSCASNHFADGICCFRGVVFCVVCTGLVVVWETLDSERRIFKDLARSRLYAIFDCLRIFNDLFRSL